VKASIVRVFINIAWVSSIALPCDRTLAAEPATAPPSNWMSPSLTYDGAVVASPWGGLRTGNTYVGNLHLKLTANAAAVAWPGLSGYADLLKINGGRPSQRVGDAQGVNNIEGPAGSQIEELWLQQNFKGSAASVLAGIYDLNSEFYRLQGSGLFLNSAFGIGTEFSQGGVEGPSIFPRTAAGVRVAIKPEPTTVVRIALLDGVPLVRPDGSRSLFKDGDGWLGVVEAAFLTRADDAKFDRTGTWDRVGRLSTLAPYGDKLAIGAWYFSGRFPTFAPNTPNTEPGSRRGSSGLYVIGEHSLQSDGNNADSRLSAFFQAGVADPRTNRFVSHLGAGLVGTGWGTIRQSDQVGIAVTRSTNGSQYRRAQSSQGKTTRLAETTIELSYLSQLSEHITLQPDLQYVRHPNTDPAIANAWVLQLRFELSF
jgi:porin